jgi:AraC-like DNA-binding protein
VQLPSNPTCVLVQMHATTLGESPVHRRMERASFGQIALSRIASVPQTVAARLDEVPAHALESTQFQLVRSGTLVLEQGGRQTAYAPGELAVYDAASPFSFHYPERFSTTIVQIPTVLLDARGAVSRVGRPVRSDSLGHRLLAELLGAAESLADEHPRDPAELSAAMVRALRLVVAEQDGTAREDRVRAGELARAVLDHVHRHHSDPSLTAASIAAHFHVSLRTVHAAFADRDEKLGATIRQLRLRAAERLLVTTDLPVADVAASVGYTDVTAFIRSWTATTGRTPGRWRRERSGIGAAVR